MTRRRPNFIECRAWRHERHEGRFVLWLRQWHVLLPVSPDKWASTDGGRFRSETRATLCALPAKKGIDRKYWGSAGAPRGQRRDSLFFKALPRRVPARRTLRSSWEQSTSACSCGPTNDIRPVRPGGRHAFVPEPIPSCAVSLDGATNRQRCGARAEGRRERRAWPRMELTSS